MTRIEHKDVGDRAQPQATFTVAGAVTDPTQIVVKQQDADGTETTIATAASPATLTPSTTPLARVSQGIYKLNPGIALTKAGHWFFRFEATGTAESAEDYQYDVDPSEFYDAAGLSSRALVTLPEVKDWLNVQQISTENDLDLARVINDVSDRLMEEADREFKPNGTNPAARIFPVEYTEPREAVYIDGVFFGYRSPMDRKIRIGDLASAPTLVRVLDVDWTTSLETVTAAKQTLYPTVRRPWQPITEIEFQTSVTALSPGMRVEVTGTWGFPSVPGDIRQAALDSIAAIMDRDVEHYRQDLGVSTTVQGEAGNTIVIGGGRQRLLSLPPAALAVAWRYRTPALG